MSNINRDYLIVLNPKTSKVTVPELNYYIYDKYTANLFVNLVTVENGKIVNMVDADQYKLVLHVVKPTNEIQDVENIELVSKEKALFQIELDQQLTKNIGRYKCELLTIDKTDHIVQSAKFSYRVKKSIYNDLDVVTETPEYPIIITLLDKLQDIDKYEEERRANEVARVAAEKARVKDYTDLRQTVTTDIDTMQEKIDSFDGKVQEVDSAVQQMRTNITNYQTEKNKELDSYKTQKDTQINTAIKGMENTIDTYKTEKDTEINDKITQQDTKIDKAIALQNKNIQASTKALNDKLDAAVQDQNDTIAANNQAQNKVISDAVAAQNKTINTVVESDKVQNDRLDTLETSDTNNKAEIKKLQDTDVEHEERMTAIEAVNVEQNNRLDAIEIKNDQQDSRLNDVEAKNKKQDLDLKCLFAESHSERITLEDEVGNSVFLQNSKQGFATVDELKGNTLVNCNKDTDKELILNGNIDTSGYGTVTTTEGVDGGKVDVALEGNTMVNVCEQEDPIAITKNYEVATGNHVALQGEYDGKCRPVLNGNTMVNLVGDINSKGYVTIANNEITYDLNNDGYPTCTFNVNGLVNGRTYTLLIDIKKNSHYVIIGGSSNKEYEISYINKCTTTGKFISKFTIPDDGKVYNLLPIWTEAKNYNKELVVSFPIILEGDYTNKPIPDYFTGLQSSFEDKLITDEKDANNGKYKVDYKVTGKNKFNKSKTLDGYEINNIGAGTIVANDKWFVTDFIPAIPNTTYAISGKGNGNTVMCYDENKQFIYGIANGGISQITTPSNVRYIKLNGLLTQKDTFQLEEGTTATTYEPYKEYTKTFYLNSPLLEGDTIEDVNGKATHVHRYVSITFDGSDDESWTSNGNIENSYFRYIYNNNTDAKKGSLSSICDKFTTSSMRELKTGIVENTSTGKIQIVCTIAGLDKFKQSLQQNPITVVYQLNTPTYETISNDSILCDSYVNGHLDVDSIIPIDKVVFKRRPGIPLKYQYVSTTYTVQFVSDNIGKLNAIFFGGNKNPSISIDVIRGVNRISLDTGNGDLYNSIHLDGIGFNASNIVVTPKVEQTFGYFKGMKSVGQNDVNGHKIEILSSKNITPSSYVRYTINGIEFNFGSKIINENVYVHNTSNKSIMVHTNVNGKYSRGFMIVKNSKKLIELKEGEVIYCASVNYVNGWSDSDVEKARNSFIITKKENELNKKEILMNEPLRGLPNGARDKYVIIDGKWYIERNCMAVQFKDLKYSRTDVYQKAEFPDVIGFRLMNTGINAPILCDRFAYTNDRIINFGELLTNKENINITSGGSFNEFFITIQKAKLTTLDSKGLMKYFTDNPMEIITKATTPTYEPIEYNSFEVYSNTTHISNNSNIPCNMVIRNSGFNCILKPNTTYTVSSNNGLSSVVTKDSIGDSVLRFYDKDTSSITKMNNVLVLEGDYITGNPPIPAFFKGMESTFEQELVTDEQDKNYGKYKVNVKATNPDNSQENNITFYIKEPLRGVGNVKDKVYVKEDKVVVERNCGSVTLDGSENKKISLNAIRGNLVEFIITDNLIPNRVGVKYVATTLPNIDGVVEKVVCGYRSIYIQLHKTKLQSIDVPGFRQWLQANPVTVVYELATPTYEEVEYFDLKLFVEIFKDTTIIYNSNIPVTSTINYTFSVPIVEQVNTLSKDVTAVQESANTVMTLASIMEDEVNK